MVGDEKSLATALAAGRKAEPTGGRTSLCYAQQAWLVLEGT